MGKRCYRTETIKEHTVEPFIDHQAEPSFETTCGHVGRDHGDGRDVDREEAAHEDGGAGEDEHGIGEDRSLGWR